MTAEEKIARVREFRLIDDVFFEVFAEDKEACQEILQVILEEDGLTVLDVVVQSSKRNISEHDFIGGAHTIYHVDKVIRETGGLVDDGLHELYVNTKVKDGSKISDLMECFIQREMVDNKDFPAVSRRVRELKTTEGGADAVCDIVKKLVDEGRAEGHAEGILDILCSLVADGVISVTEAIRRATVSPEEFETRYTAWKANQ